MDKIEVLKILSKLGTEQNIKIYKRHGAKEPLFGVSFANIEKTVKLISKNFANKDQVHTLGLDIWDTNNTDAQTLALKILNPKKVEPIWAEKAVDQVDYYVVADLLAKLLSKTDFADSLVKRYTKDRREYPKRIGFAVLNEFTRIKNWPEDYFEPFINQVEIEIHNSPNRAKEAMNNCLIAIGSIDQKMRERIIVSAKKIGPVEIDHGQTSCQTFEIVDYLNKIYTRRS